MKANPKSVLKKLKIAKGQLEGIIKRVEEDEECLVLVQQLMASQALIRNSCKEILQAHMESCVVEAVEENNPEKMKEAFSFFKELL